MTPVRLEPTTLRSRVKRSSTEPLRSLRVILGNWKEVWEFLLTVSCNENWTKPRENLILLHTNNIGADQFAHPHILISVFVVCCLASTTTKHATCYFYPPTKSEGYSFGVVRASVHSVRPHFLSVRSHISVPIGQI